MKQTSRQEIAKKSTQKNLPISQSCGMFPLVTCFGVGILSTDKAKAGTDAQAYDENLQTNIEQQVKQVKQAGQSGLKTIKKIKENQGVSQHEIAKENLIEL